MARYAMASTTMPVPVVPRRQRALLGPQARTLRLRGTLQRRQVGIVAGVRRVDPGHASANLGRGYVRPTAAHLRHHAAIAVFIHRLQRGPLPKAKLRQMLPRLLPKRLAGFGRVDGGDAHLDLLVGTGGAAAGGEGVAVADGDDQAKQGGGEGHLGLNVGRWRRGRCGGCSGLVVPGCATAACLDSYE